MALLDIVTYPDPFLKKPTKPVGEIDERIHKLIEDMADTMYDAPGVGLAANQVGIDQSIVMYDPQPDPEKREYNIIINPEIVSSEGQFLSEDEGCLSVPEYRADVKRAAKVVVKALNMKGEPVTIEAEGFLAVILQHEIDHLNGILFIDRISALKRQMYKKKVAKLLKQKA